MEKKEKKKKLTKEEKQKEYDQMVYDFWPGRRAKGKMQFILRFGVISWGFFTYVLYWVITLALNAVMRTGATYPWFMIMGSAAAFLTVGAVYGWVLWQRNEKIFLKKYPYGKSKR